MTTIDKGDSLMQTKVYMFYDPANECFWEKKLTYYKRKSIWKRKGDAKSALRCIPHERVLNGLVPKVLHIYEFDLSNKDDLKSRLVEIIPDAHKYIETGEL